MRDYYEELWRDLPEELTPPDRELRVAFMGDHVGEGDRVLDLGCGDGWMAAEMTARGATVIGVEVAFAALARARARHPELDVRHVEIDGPLPLPDTSVDVVWASEVIEHVGDTARWLSEVRRVLRPQGRLLVTTPNHSRLRLLVAGIELYSEPLGDHLHLYSESSLRTVLADFDFAEIEIGRVGGPPLARRMLTAHAVR